MNFHLTISSEDPESEADSLRILIPSMIPSAAIVVVVVWQSITWSMVQRRHQQGARDGVRRQRRLQVPLWANATAR
jgi:heme/copper-type cytochrome/quinol oxidase subunit 2